MFADKPDPNILTLLKDNGFTYRAAEKAWTIPANAETRKMTDELARNWAGPNYIRGIERSAGLNCAAEASEAARPECIRRLRGLISRLNATDDSDEAIMFKYSENVVPIQIQGCKNQREAIRLIS